MTGTKELLHATTHMIIYVTPPSIIRHLQQFTAVVTVKFITVRRVQVDWF